MTFEKLIPDIDYTPAQYGGIVKLFEGVKNIIDNESFIIAGGSIRDIFTSHPINDIDCFFLADDTDSYNCAVECFNYCAKLIKKRRNSHLFHHKELGNVDLVLSEHAEPIKIIESFDIVASCALFNPITSLVAHNKFVWSCNQGTVLINKITLPYHTLGRVAKLKSKGWNVDSDTEMNLLDYCYKAPWGPGVEFEYNN